MERKAMLILASLVVPLMALASSPNVGGQAAATAVSVLSQWAPPVIEVIAVILLVVGILAAAFEFFKRSIGWALGLFVGSTVIFAVLWLLAGQVGNVIGSIYSVLAGL